MALVVKVELQREADLELALKIDNLFQILDQCYQKVVHIQAVEVVVHILAEQEVGHSQVEVGVDHNLLEQVGHNLQEVGHIQQEVAHIQQEVAHNQLEVADHNQLEVADHNQLVVVHIHQGDHNSVEVVAAGSHHLVVLEMKMKK